MSLISLSGDNRIDSLLIGSVWPSNSNSKGINLTFSIPSNNAAWPSFYDGAETDRWFPLNTAQSNSFRAALSTWTELANINLKEVFENGNQVGDIRIAYSSLVSLAGFAAWAYSPDRDAFQSAPAGDIWLDPEMTDLTFGTYAFSTLIHELGHSFGLKHPFETEQGNNALLRGIEDTTQYSIMSYTDYDGAGNIYTSTGNGNYTFVVVQPVTPMLYDVLAIQYMYGANMQTRTGNDTYTFSNSQGELKTIWDAGGIDTIDLSNQTLPMTLDLNDGTFSSIGVKQTSFNGGLQTATNNIAIAFNTLIENAVGGAGNDTLIGNEADNTFTGMGGDDIIRGGNGIDTAQYNGQRTNYTIQQTINNQFLVASTNEGIDLAESIEIFQFEDQSVGSSVLAGGKPLTAAEVDKSPEEKDENYINYFLLELASPLTVDATVSYETRDGTAKQGEDYVQTSGIATILAGETHTTIPIEIIGDNLAENDETFILAIRNPVGGTFPSGLTEITATHTILDDDGDHIPLSLIGKADYLAESL